ncbi:MAG: type II toxin-antitoxin system HicB family antitoxin [Methanosarcinales archaeon]
MKFKVVIKEDLEDGGYNVSCPALPGCHSQGDTIEEAIENIKEAIELYLEPEEDIPVTHQKSYQVIEVAV